MKNKKIAICNREGRCFWREDGMCTDEQAEVENGKVVGCRLDKYCIVSSKNENYLQNVPTELLIKELQIRIKEPIVISPLQQENQTINNILKQKGEKDGIQKDSRNNRKVFNQKNRRT
jgi:hypothetical protein